MNTLYQTGTLLSQSLAWALLYSLWQGLVVYGAVYLLKALPDRNARIKYYVSSAALLGMFAWFVQTWVMQYQKLKGALSSINTLSSGSDMAAQPVAPAHLPATAVEHWLPRLSQYYPAIIAVYIAGLLLMLLRFAVNLVQVQRLRKTGVSYAGHQWNDFVKEWRKRMGIVQPVKLFLSGRVSVPMVIGALKPVILLPIATINHLSTEQVEAILLHELAHIRRRDYLLNIFQTIIETILFFNPFVWLVSAIVRREREHCCDDIVVQSANPLPYAKALALLESSRTTGNSLSLAATGHKNELLNRIKRIMEMKTKNTSYSHLAIVVAALIALTFIISLCTFTPSFAQKSKRKKSDTTQNSAYYSKTIVIDDNGHKTVTEEHSSNPKKHSISDEDADTSRKTRSYSYSSCLDNDGKQISKEVEVALTNAMKSIRIIDFSDLKEQMASAKAEMNNVDWDKVRRDIDKSIADVDKELRDPEMRRKINEGVKKSLQATKEALESLADKFNDAVAPMPPAPPVAPMAPVAPMPPMPPMASHSGSSYETMLSKMESDGLIDRSKNYRVEKDGDELYINGEKQSQSVYNKYGKYLKEKSVTIKGKKGVLSIRVDD